MGKSGKKPRKKMNSKQHETGHTEKVKKEEDWSFDDIIRSKKRGR